MKEWRCDGMMVEHLILCKIRSFVKFEWLNVNDYKDHIHLGARCHCEVLKCRGSL